MITESNAGRATCRTVSVPETHATMYANMWNKVECFLGLMSWWLNTQTGNHSERVILALMDNESPATTQQLPEVTDVKETEPWTTGAVPASVCKDKHATSVQDIKAQTEKKKMSLTIMTFVFRVLKKAEKNCISGNPNAIIQRLSEKIWAEVEGEDFVITPETFKNLVIFKDLSKKWCRAEMVVPTIHFEETLVDVCIVSSFKHRLISPKQRSAMSRFFSSVGKAISNTFKTQK